ncbi:bone morphogenetic protein 7-like [Xenentodon cancila]
MLTSAVATVAFLLTWGHRASATRLTFYNSSVDDGARSSFIQRRLRSQERREIQREILSILGLPHRPRPHLRTKHNAAPIFMLDLYNTISMDTNLPRHSYYKAVLPTHASVASPQDSRLLDEADTVMSFVNLIDQDLQLQQHAREFRFDMSRIPEGEAVTAAEFRVYKDFMQERTENETFRVSVYQLLQDNLSSEVELLLLDQQHTWASEEGWLVFDLTTASTLWLVSPEQIVSLHMVLEDSFGQRRKASVAGLVTGSGPKDKQPFLVVFFKAREVQFRSIRSTHAHKGRQSNRSKAQKTVQEAMKVAETATDNLVFSKEGCKKHELYVSFRDLGWQDWIIAPEGYAAYYCEGECAFPLNSYMNATNHAIVQTLVHFINPETVPKPCCSPTQLHGISVLYFDDSSNVILKKYPNMVVRACGCH